MRAAGIEPVAKALCNRRADVQPNGLWHTKWFEDNFLVETLVSMSGTRARAPTQKDRKTTKKRAKSGPVKSAIPLRFWGNSYSGCAHPKDCFAQTAS